MGKDFIPRQDNELLGWSANLVHRLAGEPPPFQLPPGLIATLADQQAAFAEALVPCQTIASRSGAIVAIKNDCRAALVQTARRVNHLLQADPAVTNANRHELGLTVRDGRSAGTAEAREAGPIIRLPKTHNPWRPKVVALPGVPSAGTAKPAGASAVMWYLHAGDEPSIHHDDWRLLGLTTTGRATLTLPADVPPFTKVWLRARWVGPRGVFGNLSTPRETWSGPPGLRMPMPLATAA